MNSSTSGADVIYQRLNGSTDLASITIPFEGFQVTTYLFRGRICWIAQEVGQAIGYDEGGFRKALSNWDEELARGKDIDVLDGSDLAEFKAILPPSVKLTLGRSSHLTILYEPGFYLVCFRTHLALGVKLRRIMADDVMPKLVRGEPVQFKRQVPPSAIVDDTESQIRVLALRQREALGLYTVIPGLYDPEFLRHKTEHAVALVTGDRPAIENPLLDVSGYLQSRGIGSAERKKVGGQFGKKLKAAYVAQHGEAPGVLPRDVNGSSREVLCYTERDRPLFDRVFAEMFGRAVTPAAPAP